FLSKYEHKIIILNKSAPPPGSSPLAVKNDEPSPGALWHGDGNFAGEHYHVESLAPSGCAIRQAAG
ncbi:hypothetical protein, partial [Pluralibacter gergoviae]|uniref:hypothetical protein n=1 Tax=Pluralibacter gergoviae TaxID=61647 RepID=UPI001C3FFBA1